MLEGQVTMRSLPAAEPHDHMHLVVLLQEVLDALRLETQIVLVRVQADANLLELCAMAFAGVLFLVLPVFKLAVIQQLANRRGGAASDLNQVQLRFAGLA